MWIVAAELNFRNVCTFFDCAFFIINKALHKHTYITIVLNVSLKTHSYTIQFGLIMLICVQGSTQEQEH